VREKIMIKNERLEVTLFNSVSVVANHVNCALFHLWLFPSFFASIIIAVHYPIDIEIDPPDSRNTRDDSFV